MELQEMQAAREIIDTLAQDAAQAAATGTRLR